MHELKQTTDICSCGVSKQIGVYTSGKPGWNGWMRYLTSVNVQVCLCVYTCVSAHMCECVFVYVCVHAVMIDKHTDDYIHHAAFIHQCACVY